MTIVVRVVGTVTSAEVSVGIKIVSTVFVRRSVGSMDTTSTFGTTGRIVVEVVYDLTTRTTGVVGTCSTGATTLD